MQPTQPRHRRSQQQTYRPQYPDDAPRAQFNIIVKFHKSGEGVGENTRPMTMSPFSADAIGHGCGC